MNWTTEGDFSGVIDTLEEITLLRKSTLEELIIPTAWRFHEISEEEAGTNGLVRRITSEWHLPIESGVNEPMISDRLLDGFGNCWTLTHIERLRGSTRFRCQARRVKIRPEESEWVDIEKAIWEEVDIDQVSTLQITSWVIEFQALRGHLWRVSTSTKGSFDETIVDRYRIAFTEPVAVTPHNRIRTHAGEIYRVVDQSENHALGELWTIDLEKESNVPLS